MDFIVALSKSDGYRNIMVMVNRFSKYATFIPNPAYCKGDEAAQLFLKNIVKLWKILWSIINDREPRFTKKFWRELFTLLGT